MNKNVRAFFLLAVLLTYSSLLSAQSWQWGQRGGGSFDEGNVGGQKEEVTDIASDPAGNVYVLSQTFFNSNATVTVDTYQVNMDSVGRSSMLSSFTLY